MVPLALAAWALGCFAAFYVVLAAASGPLRALEGRTLRRTGESLESLWLGHALSPRRLLQGSAAVAAIAGVLLGAWVHPLVGLLGAFALLLAPVLALRWMEARRRSAFETQLPDALESLAGSLRSGFALEQGLRLLSEQSAPPLGQELRLLLREMEVGATLEEALTHLEERLPGEDLKLFVASVALSREVGGNLADVLAELAAIVRRRREVEGKLMSLTAQGRLQGVVLGLVPVGLGLALYLLEPERMRLFLASPKGWGVLALAGGLELAGILWIRRILRTDF